MREERTTSRASARRSSGSSSPLMTAIALFGESNQLSGAVRSGVGARSAEPMLFTSSTAVEALALAEPFHALKREEVGIAADVFAFDLALLLCFARAAFAQRKLGIVIAPEAQPNQQDDDPWCEALHARTSGPRLPNAGRRTRARRATATRLYLCLQSCGHGSASVHQSLCRDFMTTDTTSASHRCTTPELPCMRRISSRAKEPWHVTVTID
jgi:hypothetical protein